MTWGTALAYCLGVNVGETSKLLYNCDMEDSPGLLPGGKVSRQNSYITVTWGTAADYCLGVKVEETSKLLYNCDMGDSAGPVPGGKVS